MFRKVTSSGPTGKCKVSNDKVFYVENDIKMD